MYTLSADGGIQNWLACGPVYAPIDYLGEVVAQDGSPFGDAGRWVLNYWAYDPRSISLKRKLFRHRPLFTWQPQPESPQLHQAAFEGQQWRYATTEEDQTIDFSRFNFTPNLLRAWLYTQLTVTEDSTLAAELLTIGPAQIWVNGVCQHQFDKTFSYVETLKIPVELHLKSGTNALYIHGLIFGWREQRLALGLRLKGQAQVSVSIPTGDVPSAQWLSAESALQHIQLDRFAITQAPGALRLDEAAAQGLHLDIEASIPLHGSPWARFGFLEMPSAKERVFLHPGGSAPLPLTPAMAAAMAQLPGENTLALRLRPADGTPLEQQRHVWLSQNQFSHQPYGDFEQRRQEALHHLAGMSYDVFAAMAAVALGQQAHIATEAVSIACEFMENRYDCADFYALSLMALLYLYEDALLPADKARIESAFMGFKFWIDEPGLDAMCYFTENHQILFHVTAYLAGQRWPGAQFRNSGRTGRQQRDRAQKRIGAWILNRLQGGYSEWDSNAYMALDIFAMLAVFEFAASPRLKAMAEALLHKSFFMLAAQSYRGAHGSTHGRCYVEGLKSARVENTSSIQRMAWGMGIFNGETRATGMLALARNYRVPALIAQMAVDMGTLSTQARSYAPFRPQFDMRGDHWDVRTLTRRTAHYMLSAALDYEPGGRGVQEHLWQATLSPEAVVFTNYPGNSQEHGHARPNFWAGSARLPRVMMQGRTVFCLYALQPGVGLGFSHAYFPVYAFDEWLLQGQWAFARYGSGYLALWGDGPLHLTQSGRHTGQELRSAGPSAAWICTVGSADEDGDFAAFQAGVCANAPTQEAGQLIWTPPGPDAQTLRLGWEGPFMVGGRPLDLADYPHYRNAYTDTPLHTGIMSIAKDDDTLTLDLAKGRVI